MIQPICKDVFFLSRPSRPARIQDSAIGADLLDTLKANRERCVGMAANMIGQAVRIIAVDNGGEYLLMYDPEILKREGAYEAEEGCLSLEGHPEGHPLQKDQGPLPKRGLPDPHQNLSGFYGPDHSA